MSTRYASRKFILAILALAAGTAMVYLKAIESAAYATIVLSTVGAYIAGNVAQKKVTS